MEVKIWKFLSTLFRNFRSLSKVVLFLSPRICLTGSFNVAISTLDFRDAPYSGPFCEEKQRPGEGAKIVLSCNINLCSDYGCTFYCFEKTWYLGTLYQNLYRITKW